MKEEKSDSVYIWVNHLIKHRVVLLKNSVKYIFIYEDLEKSNNFKIRTVIQA